MRKTGTRNDCEEQSATGLRVLAGPMRKLPFNIVCLALSFLAIMGSVNAQQAPDEYELKAAFLYNFAKFVEWPAEALGEQTPLILGILGDDPFKKALAQIEGKSVNGRKVIVRRLTTGQDLKSCHILFISSSERKRMNAIIGSLQGSHVLTVSEMEGFATNGGMIALTMDGKKVRFIVNGGVAGRARLKISSRLLSLATRIVY